MLSPGEIATYCILALLQGALVVLPRARASVACDRLRSAAWALVLPAALIVGTFGVLAVPRSATWLALLAAIATPVLVALAVFGVVRGPRRLWLAVLPAVGVAAVSLDSWPGQLAASVLTALGCLTVGAALVRLTPLPWLAAGIVAMCILDVVFLADGVGEPAAALLDTALSHSTLPEFHHAQLGGVTKDYPDLVLTAVLGVSLAGHARQLTAAVLVSALVCANGVFFLVIAIVPGTVPLAIAGAAVAVLDRRAATTRRTRPTAQRPAGLPRPALRPGAAQPMEA
jgi:hypothetical protein